MFFAPADIELSIMSEIASLNEYPILLKLLIKDAAFGPAVTLSNLAICFTFQDCITLIFFPDKYCPKNRYCSRSMDIRHC